MTSPAWVSNTDTTFTTAASSYAANTPATDASDRLVAIVLTYASRTWGAAPTDWAQLATSGDYVHVYERVDCPSASAGTATFTISGGTTVAIVRVVRISGSHASDAASISTFGTGTNANPDPPNLDPAVSKDWLWLAIAHWSHFFGTDRSRSSQPTNYTATTDVDIQPSNGELETSLAYRQLTASSENPGTFTLSGNAQTWRAVTIGIPPSVNATGTIAATLQKALFSGSGAQTQTGTIAATLQAATAALSGTHISGAEGTVSATMQAATASFVGAMQPSGTVAATMQPATFNGAAAQVIAGVIAAELQNPTFAATGTQTIAGTIAAALTKALFSGAGSQTQTGSMVSTLQKATSSLTGFMVPSGSIASTMRPPTSSFVGVMQPSGVVAVTMRPALFTGTGLHTQSGVIAAALQAALLTATGQHSQTGTMAATMQIMVFEAIAILRKLGYGTVADALANGGRLFDYFAYGGTLSDAYTNGGRLADAFAFGGTIDDNYTNGGTASDE